MMLAGLFSVLYNNAVLLVSSDCQSVDQNVSVLFIHSILP